MTHLRHRVGLALATVAMLLAPSIALGQSAQFEGGYAPPKLLKQGTFTTPLAGPGLVVVKVLVHPDGTFAVQGVIKSTNHGDEAAALEIAKTSKYKPAYKQGKPELAFYDFSLKFTGSSVSSTDSETGGDVAKYEGMMSAGNVAGAKSGLTDFVAAHPGDNAAQAALGTADALGGDPAGAVKAYDAAGTVPAKYTAVAAQAYAQYAVAQAHAKNGSEAVAAAKKAVQYSATVPSYNALGVSSLAAGDSAAGVAAFEKATQLASADPKSTATNKATLQANLASAYAEAGEIDKAKAAAAEVQRLDPSSKAGETALASYYIGKATDLENAGKMGDAATQYEAAAGVQPSQAVTYYTRASFSYLKMKPNADNAKAKADADKALALAPTDAQANFAAGVALANQGSAKDALVYLNKADASAKAANDTALASAVESAIKQLGGSK
jgi:Flp pilus assembly protein TadD